MVMNVNLVLNVDVRRAIVLGAVSGTHRPVMFGYGSGWWW
jgi:hypothetical protein